MSLLGLAGYDSDGSDADEGDPRLSPQQESSSGGVNSTSAKLLEDNQDSQQGGPVEEEADANREARTGVLRASSFDAPAPPSKESKQIFMPLPSPLVRLDNASPSASSPFPTYEPPEKASGVAGSGEGSGGGAGEGAGEGAGGGAGGGEDDEKKDEGERDIIKPEYRDLLPPEATGPANPALRAKVQKLLNRMQGDFTAMIKGKKEYGNPAVLAQICRYCSVDDKGTNYPADRMVHPSVYDTKDFHDSLMMQEQRRAKRPKPDESKAKAAAAAQGAAAAAAKAAAAKAAKAAKAAVTAAATAAPPLRPAAAAGPPVALATGGAGLPAPGAGTTRKRGSKWGIASNTSLPFPGQQMQGVPPIQMPHVQGPAAGATSIPRAGSARATAGRVGFSADPGVAAARAGQAALLNAQAQAALLSAQAQAEKEAQQRAEAIARVQMIASRAGRGQHEPPKKQPRLS